MGDLIDASLCCSTKVRCRLIWTGAADAPSEILHKLLDVTQLTQLRNTLVICFKLRDDVRLS